jgi:hypothetical protein
MRWLSLIALLLAATTALADDGVHWSTRTRLGLVYSNFSGDQYKSVGNNATAFGGEVSILKGAWSMGDLIGKVRGLYISGKNDFLDGTTPITDASFTIFAGEPCLGVQINLMPFYPPGFRAYLSGLGVMSYDILRFSNSATLTTLTKSQSAVGFGYELSTGVETTFKRDNGGQFLLYGEIQYRDVRTKLAGQSSFQLTGLQIAGGLGW